MAARQREFDATFGSLMRDVRDDAAQFIDTPDGAALAHLEASIKKLRAHERAKDRLV